VPAATLETLARQATESTVPAGTVVIAEGERGDQYYVIVSGHVGVSKDGAIINHLGPGSGFGEIALVQDIPRTATVVALDDVALLAIDRRSFLITISRSAPTILADEPSPRR
jgi:CRP-like cAMP-binding protein